ncbi:MAG: Hsp33 family molecular chaperone HslO [Candidatus Binatia bacterium]|nr:Hsp33 family molecular chaperone HslO [Candidatus Binatia bacterium]
MSQAKARYFARKLARKEADSVHLPFAPPLAEDTLWRGMTRGGELRLLVVRATASVREVSQTLATNGDTGRLVAELTAGGLLVRSAMDPDAQVQLTIRNPGAAGSLYLDVWASGAGFRASMQHPEVRESAEAPLFLGGEFDLLRSRAGGTPHRSARVLDTESLSDAFMAHLLDSDQIRAVLQLDVRYAGDDLIQACGFLVQITPEGGREDIERLLENLEEVPPLADLMTDADPDARAFGDRLFEGYKWDQSAREDVSFVCRCSRERLVAVLKGLPENEVREMVEEGTPIETTCEFCLTKFEISPEELQRPVG